jgi:hypothetical protein
MTRNPFGVRNADGLDWHQGSGTLRLHEGRVYVLFDWDDGTKQGLRIDGVHSGGRIDFRR